MMNKYKNLIIVVVIIIGGFFAYNTFLAGDLSPSASLQVTNSADILGADIIKAINQINTLKLDRGVFDDPIFKTLVDRSEEIMDQNSGRPNPFAPVTGVDFSVSNDGTQLNFDSTDSADASDSTQETQPEQETEIPAGL